MMGAFKHEPISRDILASEALLPAEVDENGRTISLSARHRRRTNRCMFVAVISPYILLLILGTYVLYLRHRLSDNPARFAQTLYSPAQEALKTEIKVFELGFADEFHDETTVYQGQPSPELDARWESLYKPGVTKINQQQASKLPNQTMILPHQGDDQGDERGYGIMLDVFHQLHCLNMVRKALYPEYYKPEHLGHDGEDELLGMHHVDHCIDSLRQSLMCSVDVSPLVWQWSDERKMYLIKAQVPHVCRNFDAVYEWASGHLMKENFDSLVRQWNDPLDQSTWI